MISFLPESLEDMRVGWQKVADRYSMTIYVFKFTHTITGDQPNYMAVTNRAQGMGELVETLTPATVAEPAPQHGVYEIEAAARV